MDNMWEQIPFSAYGAWLVLSIYEDGIWIRDVHGGDDAPSRLYRLSWDGEATAAIERTETELVLRNTEKAGSCRFTFDLSGRLHILIQDMQVRLHARGSSYDTLVPLTEHCLEHQFYEKQQKVRCCCLSGKMEQQQQWTVRGSAAAVICLGAGGAKTHAVLEQYKTVPGAEPELTYEQARAEITDQYQAWQQGFAGKETEQNKASLKLAIYLTWANIVRAEGRLTADAMYMTKNVMYNIWSWDNCFGAMALAQTQPELAYGQIKIFMDIQDECGCYPDYVNDSFASWNCVKPPIHAWAYRRMAKKNEIFLKPEYLEPVYESLVRMTGFWMNCRIPDGAIYPVYYHGNDSGWDNASIFNRGVPIESPDLAAFLIHQMDLLADFAGQLDKTAEQLRWQRLAAQWSSGFRERFWHNGRLRARHLPTGAWIEEGDSLLPFMSLLMGERLDSDIREALVHELEEVFEQEYGLATEAPASPAYRAGGYWLGPVWAPVTYILIDALRSCGYPDFAARLAAKFMKVTKSGRMAENYDPFTGAGYDDPGFSWSACVYLLLLEEYRRE